MYQFLASSVLTVTLGTILNVGSILDAKQLLIIYMQW